MSYYYGWKPYVPVAARRHQASKKLAEMRKKGLDVQPVEIEGRKIAGTFWGQAWCQHMEAMGDFANRLPRGRTYVRNGSVCHLAVEKGKVTAIVSGSELYNVVIKINQLGRPKWTAVKQQCSGRIGSLLELLEGRISGSVMEVVTERTSGLFPLSKEITFDCDCPDYATMCKHVAAVLYGVGARLDRNPESLFLLRGVDHAELITASADESVAKATTRNGGRRRVVATDLADVFGVELESGSIAEASTTSAPKKSKRKAGNLKKTEIEKAISPAAKAKGKAPKKSGGSNSTKKVASGVSRRSAKRKPTTRSKADSTPGRKKPK